MSRFLTLLVAALLAAFAQAQQAGSPNTPLGDLAREQKEIRKQNPKNGGSAKVLTTDDVSSGKTADAGNANASSPSIVESASAGGSDAQAAPSAGKNPAGSKPAASALDRPKDPTPDTILVPAGTELKIDVEKHKVVVPVRVGFATPIPALSQATVQVTRTYITSDYSNNGMPYVDYVEYATVTAVTVGGNTYEVQTDSVPLMKGGTNSEVTFILGGPVKVSR